MRRGVVVALITFAVLALCGSQVSASGTGYSIGMMFPNLNDLNIELENAGFEAMANRGLYYGGYATIDIGKLSVGYFGAEGTMKSVNELRSAALTLTYGGILAEYSVNLAERLKLSVGGVLGGGTAKFATRHGQIEGFDQVLHGGNTSSVWRPYVLAQPQASLMFPISHVLQARLTGGYTYLHGLTGWMEGTNFRDRFPGPLNSVGYGFVQLGISFGPPMNRF